jgi:Tfp pilus assembly protein PilF
VITAGANVVETQPEGISLDLCPQQANYFCNRHLRVRPRYLVTRRRLIVPLILVLLGSASAQFDRTGNLKVRITFPDGHPCNLRVKVQLMLGAGSTPVAETYTDENGQTDFDDIEVGNYHLIVSGEGIEETDSGLFEVDNRKASQFETVTVRRTDEANQNGGPGGTTVSVVDMNIPKNANKLFDKATQSIADKNWEKALDQLNQAIAIYPRYVQAYNNLGVVYARMGNRPSEREALEKAISLNDHFAPAWVNLGRMAIIGRDFPTAETMLDKAAGLDPTNSETLLILANVELMNLHYDQAIANCRKVHAIGQDSHALVHFIAARALEHESRLPDAEAELRTFLKEEPDGARAEAARKELANLQKSVR